VLAHEWLQHSDRVSQINPAYYPALLVKELANTYAIDPERITLETSLAVDTELMRYAKKVMGKAKLLYTLEKAAKGAAG
jgi:hypothetical protein